MTSLLKRLLVEKLWKEPQILRKSFDTNTTRTITSGWDIHKICRDIQKFLYFPLEKYKGKTLEK